MIIINKCTSLGVSLYCNFTLYICYLTLDNNKLEAIKGYFKTRPVLKAFLFGSFARGGAVSACDIDILVDLDYNERIGLQLVQMKLDIERLLDHKVDLVSTNSLNINIKLLIENEKLLIYVIDLGDYLKHLFNCRVALQVYNFPKTDNDVLNTHHKSQRLKP